MKTLSVHRPACAVPIVRKQIHMTQQPRFSGVLNTFTLFDAPSRDVWVEHALRMCSVVRHLYDG